MSDHRSRKIAVVTSGLLDAPLTAPGSPQAALLLALERDGWGLVQMPPANLAGRRRSRALSILVDQLADWHASGYRVVLCRAGDEDAAMVTALGAALARRRLGWIAAPEACPPAAGAQALVDRPPRRALQARAPVR